MHRRAFLLLLALAWGAFADTAWAQGALGSGIPGVGSTATGKRQGGPREIPREPEPAALPGARSRGDAAPATRPTSDMGPTEMLFDAAGRGDIVTTREAVSRGADLNARNMLGLTALELAVDLGHNDIAFLLLSLRDAEAPSRGARPSATGRTVTQGRDVTTPARAPAPVRVAEPRATRSDGGRAVPDAGFLGFGNGR